MTFEFPNPTQFNEHIKNREVLTGVQKELLFKAMSEKASSTNRVIKIPVNNDFNIKHAENFLLDKGYDAHMGTTTGGDQRETYEVPVLVITLKPIQE